MISDFPGQPVIDIEHRNHQENIAFDIDMWYPLLKDITMETLFLPLTMKEHFAMVRYYRMRFLKRGAFGALFSTIDRAVLTTLEQKFDRVMSSISPPRNPDDEPAFFVRLCGRSPKDGEPLNQEVLKARYESTLADLGRRGFDLADDNTRAMPIAFLNHLQVHNGKEALSLLLTSERVYIDLHDAIRCGDFDQLVIRKWIPELTYDREFRMFVYDGELTVITQYDHYCCYPYLHDEKDAIQQRLVSYWNNEIKPRMEGVPHYIVDVADLPGKGVILIELSPFLRCTGTSLFDWRINGEQLMNGPFEFRLRSDPYPCLADLLRLSWLARFQQPIPPYWTFYPVEEDQGVFGNIKKWLSSLAKKEETMLLVFVYGLLKRGNHFHSKYLSGSRFAGTGKTVGAFKMFIDANGAPQLVDGDGANIHGEVLEISESLLEFYALNKLVTRQFYEIRKIPIAQDNSSRVVEASCLFRKIETVREDLDNVEFIEEYQQQSRFNPVMDAAQKASFYLGRPLMTMN